MKIALLQENLLKAITAASRIVPTRTQLLILQSVLVHTQEGRIVVFGTSLDTGIVCWCDGKIEKEGGVCIPAKILVELVATLPPQTVVLEAGSGGLTVSCGGFSATIATSPAAEFPPPPTISKPVATKISTKTFSDLLRHVLFAAATDESRPILSGVRFVNTGDEATAVATDGYRLSRKRISLKLPGALDMVVPGRALSEAVRLTNQTNQDADMSLALTTDGQILFAVGDVEIYTRRIDGEYPPIEKIIPKNWTTRVTADRDALVQAVKSAAIFARDNANIVRLTVNKDGIVVSANAPSVGENKIDIESKVEGEGGEIAFNSRFLLEYFSAISGDQVVFEMTGSLNPGAFHLVGDDSFLHIIMPVRVQS